MASTVGQFTDPAIAEQVAADLTDRYVHVHGLGWLAYDGKVWREVPDKVPLEVLRAWFRAQLETAGALYAGALRDPELSPKELDRMHQVVKSWARSQGIGRLKAALLLLAGLLSVEPDRLDSNPDLLNVQNGVVHLPTGELLEHRPDYYLTKIAGCGYNPTAIHADWTAALNALPVDVQNWLQVRYGQGITGHTTPDDKVIIQQGGGANGKSTVLTGVAAALGDYYFLASDKILMSSQSSAHTTDLADLRGRRFVSIEETPEAGRLDVVRLKKLAGTERITARKMHQDNLSFQATHTLFVNTNYPPVVSETDDGTWRRLLLVVFPYTFTRDPQGENERFGDPGLRERLRVGRDGQREAVLGWLVEGAVRWYDARREYPAPPESVLTTTAEWKDRTDHVAAFWADFLDPDPSSYVWEGDLIATFNNFMRQRGNAAVALLTFQRRFQEHPITTGAMVRKARMRTNDGSMQLSRPFGSLDPFSRLPEVPADRIQAWTGLGFRRSATSAELSSWAPGQGGQG
jgi:putative DNA primase/helicase